MTGRAKWVKRRGRSPRPPPRLRLNGPDKHEQLKATRSRGGEGREEGGNVRCGGAREEMQGCESGGDEQHRTKRARCVSGQ